MKIIKDRHATHSLQVHLIFVTKFRYKVFNGDHISFLDGIFKETLEEMGAELLEFNGEEDHVHLLVQYPPKYSISGIVNNLKGRSSRLVRKEFNDVSCRFYGNAKLWHRSYFAGSVGGTTLEVLKNYIQNQDRPD